MSISAVFHNEDLRKQIFQYKKLECSLLSQSVRQRKNVLECNEIIKFAYDDFTDALWEYEDDGYTDNHFIKFLHCEHYLDDEMYCKACGVGLIAEYSKGFSVINDDTQIFRFEPEWDDGGVNPITGEWLMGGYVCKCCIREFGLN
tara:strand:+ start:104 stop:538 length:435 start_codon:yes stop_codon:yes gene_type:complete